MIPRLDAAALAAGDPDTLAQMRIAAEEVGFATVHNTVFSPARMRFVLAAYGAFFALPVEVKDQVNMARTGSNRGWGAPKSEQVDPEANPDYKEVFDCGYTLPDGDMRVALPVYAPNHWPDRPAGFEQVIRAYYTDALDVARGILRGIAMSIGADADFFEDKFDCPMALLRGNYYPPRPDWAGAKDFGIGAHTDYGCLTLLATDGQSGLEVQPRGQDGWLPVQAPTGEFIINFGAGDVDRRPRRRHPAPGQRWGGGAHLGAVVLQSKRRDQRRAAWIGKTYPGGGSFVPALRRDLCAFAGDGVIFSATYLQITSQPGSPSILWMESRSLSQSARLAWEMCALGRISIGLSSDPAGTTSMPSSA